MRIKLLLLLSSTWIACTGPANALQGDTEKPMLFEANRVVIDDESGNHIYTGNVSMTQGSIIIKAERLEVLNKQGQPAHLIATGNNQAQGRALFRQTSDEQVTIKASAQKIEYFEKKSHLRLLKEAELNRGRDIFKGHQIDYNTETHRMLAGTPKPKTNTDTETGSNNGRVQVTIYPKPKQDSTTSNKEQTSMPHSELPADTHDNPSNVQQ